MKQEDRDRLIRLDEGFKTLKTDVADIKSNLDSKFAAKWVERFNLGLIAIILIGVGNAVLGLVVKAINRGN